MLNLLFVIPLSVLASGAEERPCVLTVVGAAGKPEYGEEFRRSAEKWKAAAAKAGVESIQIGSGDNPGATDHDRLRAILGEQSKFVREPIWIVLIGHGTFDGREAKFNLRGPDVTDIELARWLEPMKRPVIVLDCASASAPFLNRISGANRIVVTATRSGHETNYSRFGGFLSSAITDPQADLDKDGQVSLLEAYLTASHRVAEYYRTRSQLASEHSLLDDNGDRLGTPAEWFRGVHATRRAKDGAPLDGIRSHQLHLILSDRERSIPAETRHRRDAIELAIAALRDQKSRLTEDEYYKRLEPLMIDLGRLYRDAQAGSASHGDHTQ